MSLTILLFLLTTGCRGTDRYLVDEWKWKWYWFHGIVVGKILTSLFRKKTWVRYTFNFSQVCIIIQGSFGNGLPPSHDNLTDTTSYGQVRNLSYVVETYQIAIYHISFHAYFLFASIYYLTGNKYYIYWRWTIVFSSYKHRWIKATCRILQSVLVNKPINITYLICHM